MNQQLSFEFTEAYELLVSLYAFVHVEEQKSLDIGTSWHAQTEASVGKAFTTDLQSSEYAKAAWIMEVLAWRCPTKDTVEDFLRWLETLSGGDVYEQVAPYASDRTRPLPPNLGEVKARSTELLRHWQGAYFSKIDPLILVALAADAEQKKSLAANHTLLEVTEAATGGIVLDPASVQQVVLAPQYHYRPWNLMSNLRSVKLIFYPANALPSQRGEPPVTLRRLTNALADDSRLRIMQYLATGEHHTFTDVVRYMGLAKSTVHQHMMLLRAAGLVRVFEGTDRAVSYTFRPDRLDVLSDQLYAYFNSGGSAETK